MNTVLHISLLAFVAVMVPTADAAPDRLPVPTSAEFCSIVQKIMANTEVESNNTLFTSMPEYRHSKPSPDPLMTYQVVTYAGKRPIVVSCKIKGSAQIRATYGEGAAGEQLYCPAVLRLVKSQAIEELKDENRPDAAAKVEAFVIGDKEPYVTGRDYLSDFELSYVGEDGAIHLDAPGLFQDYDSWVTLILPEMVEGQVYCHLATVDYMKALAKGEMEPGTLITTGDDATVTPQ